MQLEEALNYMGLVAEVITREVVRERYSQLADIYHPNGIDGGEFPLMYKINEAHSVIYHHYFR